MDIKQIDRNIGNPISIKCVLDTATKHAITITKRDRSKVYFTYTDYPERGIGMMLRKDFSQA